MKKKTTNKRKQRNNKNVTRAGRNPLIAVPRWIAPRMVMPAEYDTSFKYIVDVVVGTAAATLSSVRYTTNAYDVDPTLASTAMPGFTELAALYARFRTLRMAYKFNVCNAEAFPVHVIHGFSNVSVASGSLGMNYGGNALMSCSILGPLTGQGRSIFSRSASVGQISGSTQYLYDDVFTGSTTSSTLATAGTCYCYLGLSAGANVFTAAGAIVQVEITLHVRLSRPTFLVS